MAPTIRLAGVRRRLELGRQRRRLTRILGSARSLPGYRDRLASWSPGEDPYEALARLPVLERSRVQDDPDAFRDARVDSLSLTS